MRFKPKNFPESFAPFSLLIAIIGHGFYEYPIGKVRPVFSIIYAIIATALPIAATVKIMQLIHASSWFGDEDKIFLYLVYVNYGILMIIQLLNWYHVRTVPKLRARISIVDETLQQLGATFDYPGHLREGFFIIGSWILLINCLNCIDVLWLLNVAPVDEIIMIVLVVHYPVHVNAIVVGTFSIIVRLICLRFQKLNLLLESLTKLDQSPVNDERCTILRNKIDPTRTFTISSNRTLQTLQNNYNRKDASQIIIKNLVRFRLHHDRFASNPVEKYWAYKLMRQVHLELKIISKTLDRAFGMQLILEMSAYFLLFTGLLYDLYIIVTNPSIERRYLRVTVLIVWITVYFMQLLIINRTCENISYESRRTGEIIHRLNNELYWDKEYPDEVRQFSMQLLLNQLVFSPGEFFVLGNGFVRAFLASVATYLAILIQMRSLKTPGQQG